VLANQTDIKTNANKFYIAQAISTDSGSRHFCCTRWGRVGEKGQNKVEECGSAAAATAAYQKKKKEKVKPGKYTEILIKHGGDGDASAVAGAAAPKAAAKAKGGKAAAKPASSKLHPKIQVITDLDTILTELDTIGLAVVVVVNHVLISPRCSIGRTW
jgi:poly [ADP-ribose] polymerase